MESIVIGVLSLQGDFAKHIEMLRSIGVEAKEVRTPQDLEACDGLIIPGGESTVISRQLDFIQLTEPLSHFAQSKPVFGTCAGLILMSKHVQGSSLKPLKLLDVIVERNAFGRQIESFQASLELSLNPDRPKACQAFFIRAPRIRQHGHSLQVLATYEGEPVLVRQGHHLGASFHPELTGDPTVHAYFVELVKEAKRQR